MANKNFTLPILITVAVVAVLGSFGYWFFQNSQKNNPPVVTLPRSTTPSETNQPENKVPVLGTPSIPSSTSAKGYKNGKFLADGNYTSPEGAETVGVELTIAENKISSVVITPKATDKKSIRYQGLFADGIKGVIVGKSLDENLDPGTVNGSSLTGKGFVQAVENIKQQAKL